MPKQHSKEIFLPWNLNEFTDLYHARYRLRKNLQKTLGLLIPVNVYLQDPLVAERAKQAKDKRISERTEWQPLNNIYVPCEPDLLKGPTSARIAVVDYDADINRLEEPVEWDRAKRRFFIKQKRKKVFLTKNHCDLPQFHQVNVWAIVQSVLSMYEQTWIMGRSVPWAFGGNRLIVVPHAGYLPNAFYDRRSKSIQFYYFGPKLRRVYTCLSHDIIAHETGHAILDGLRPYYIEDSSLQTAAFHEFLADLTAILSSLLNNEMRWKVAEETSGDLTKETIVSSLAEQFGQYTTGRPHLRSALNQATMDTVRDSINPYDWSQVLIGAMWDILTQIAAKVKAKPRKDKRTLSDIEILLQVVNSFRRLAFQPLDYLPPIDVQFNDYASAVLRADEEVYPVDEDGYREIMKEVFESRSIDYAKDEDLKRQVYFYAYDIDRLSRSRTDAYHFLNENRRQLCIPEDQDISVVDLYQTDKTIFNKGRLPREIVLQYAWREEVELKDRRFGPLQGEWISLLCGGTLVFDSSGNVISWMHKPGTGRQESDKRRLRKYCEKEQERGMQRKKQLLDYIAARIEGGYVGLTDPGRTDEIEARPPVVAERTSDGTLRMEVTPHLRHWKGE